MTDSLALIDRSLRHSIRSVDALLTAVLLPVMLLLLFVYVFGGAIDAGTRYLDYVVPGIVLLCAGFGAATTAVSVNADLASGMTDRFRSLPIAAAAPLTGHVVASIVRNLVSTALVLGVALMIGFEPSASFLEWLGVLGVLLAFMAAISWLAAAFGLLLPYVSSAFVPPETMPGGLQAIAEHQPVTPIIDTLRGLLLGTPGADAPVALAWCLGFAAIGATAAAVLFRRRTR
jgi:ABC-2 type transport system permease protein